jgi:hypothetical protein
VLLTMPLRVFAGVSVRALAWSRRFPGIRWFKQQNIEIIQMNFSHLNKKVDPTTGTFICLQDPPLSDTNSQFTENTTQMPG